MLVTFPIGAFGFSVVSDVLHAYSGERRYSDAAQQALDFGLISAALAVPFGAIDWRAIPGDTRAKRVGLWHGLGNTAVMALFGASRWLRREDSTSTTAKWLSGAGFALAGVTAWLGGELVDRHGIGVRDRLSSDWPEDAPRLAERNQLRDDAASMPISDDAPTLPGFRVRATPARA